MLSIHIPCIFYYFVLWPTNAQIFQNYHTATCFDTRVILRQLVINAFNTCTVHLLLFCTMTNKCTIISQIITLLHVSTLSCHPQGASNQCFQNMYLHLLLFCTITNKCKIISKMITLLHTSTLSCHPQAACNQYLAKLHQYFKCGRW